MNPNPKDFTTGMPAVELPLARIPLNEPMQVATEQGPLLVMRSSQGVLAYEDRCPHAFWPLSNGEVCESVLECPGHGWKFDLETGRCLNVPAYCLSAVKVTIEGETVRLHPRTDNALSAAASVSSANENHLGECLH